MMEVSKAGFYSWRRRSESTHQREDRRPAVLVRESRERSRRTYGSPRVHAESWAPRKLVFFGPAGAPLRSPLHPVPPRGEVAASARRVRPPGYRDAWAGPAGGRLT